ncbi:MAG: VWA domain-containing protein [Oligoflexia bacterium]|nr:VWA domain-containing protein [Oligoflexia bacterium]
MKFGNIHYLYLLTLIPLIILFYWWAFKRKQILIEKFVSKELKERLLTGVSFTRQKLKALTLIVATTFLILSLLRPQWGFHWEEVKRRGVDIIIALDVSKSMLAQDVTPNRLERAKRKIKDLLQIVQGDRLGLVAFAGVSFLEVPLTLDFGAIQLFLDELDTSIIPIPGTAIADAVQKSIKAFDTADKKSRVLILITDGEDHEGDPVEAAKKAAEQGIKIYTIGIGKEGGAPIPDGEGGALKKDAKGEVILSQLNEDTLQKMALATGGSYVRSVTGDLDLEKIYTDIRKSVEDKELKSGRQKRFEERFQFPLLIAILLLAFEAIFRERKGRKESKKTSLLSLSFFLLGLVFLLASNTHASTAKSESSSSIFKGKAQQGESYYKDKKYDLALKNYLDAQIEDPKNEQLKYNMANSYYKMGQFEEADKLFQSLTQSNDPKISFKALYNLGNTSYRQGKLYEAVEFYKQALKINPNDEDAKFNLEFVQKEIKRRIEEQKKQQQQQQQQNKQNNSSCPNKQPGGQGQDQKQQQQKDQQQKEEQQKKEQQQQEQQQQQQQQQQKDAKMGNKQDEKKDEKKGEKEDQANAAKLIKKGKFSEEEAKRILSTLDENKKKFLKQNRQEGNADKYRVEKDW